MPRGDKTGPMGQGPASGRARGGCAPTGAGRSFFGFGRGAGRGRGFWGCMPWNNGVAADSKSELSYLEEMQKNIAEQIKNLKKPD